MWVDQQATEDPGIKYVKSLEIYNLKSITPKLIILVPMILF
jgi:hypothetical protein